MDKYLKTRRSETQKIVPIQAYLCMLVTAAGANPSFIASQMGHTNAQMVFNVYGAWMKDNNHEQIELLNKRLSESVPCMPHKKAG